MSYSNIKQTVGSLAFESQGVIPELGGELLIPQGFRITPFISMGRGWNERSERQKALAIINGAGRGWVILFDAEPGERPLHLRPGVAQKYHGQVVESRGYCDLLDRATNSRGGLLCPPGSKIYLIPINPETREPQLQHPDPIWALYFEAGFAGWVDYDE